MSSKDIADFAIELRFEPVADWLWAVIDAEGLTLTSGSSTSRTQAWRTATRAAETLQQARQPSQGR